LILVLKTFNAIVDLSDVVRLVSNTTIMSMPMADALRRPAR
jgi:hypothetical protein